MNTITAYTWKPINPHAFYSVEFKLPTKYFGWVEEFEYTHWKREATNPKTEQIPLKGTPSILKNWFQERHSKVHGSWCDSLQNTLASWVEGG